jgi:5-methylcytosine-specific restriction endonuclease McrA
MNIFGININFGNRSHKWPALRNDHLRINNRCAACGNTKNLHVHHIEPFYVRPEKELDPDNLITLCSSPCHLVFGHLMNWKRWNPDVVNDCETFSEKIQKTKQ